MDKRFWHHFPPRSQDVTSLVLTTKKNYLLKGVRGDIQEDVSRGIELFMCVCVCVLSEGEGFWVFRKAAVWKGGMRSFMSNDQLMELKRPLSVSCLHTPSLKHTYTLKHPHTGWKDPFYGSLTHQPLTHLFPRPLSHTDTRCPGTKPEALTLIVSWLSLQALSGAVLNPLTHSHTYTTMHTHTALWRSVKRKMIFFFILILHFQKPQLCSPALPLFLIFFLSLQRLC